MFKLQYIYLKHLSLRKCFMFQHWSYKLAGVKKSILYLYSILNIKMYLTFIFLLKLHKYMWEKYYSHFIKMKVTVQKVRWFAIGHKTRKSWNQKSAQTFLPACAYMHEDNTIPATISLGTFGQTVRTKFLELPGNWRFPGMQYFEFYYQGHPRQTENWAFCLALKICTSF